MTARSGRSRIFLSSSANFRSSVVHPSSRVVTNHSLSVHATFQRRVVVERARQALVEAPEIVALDADGEYPTPIDSVGVDPRFVGRVRQDPQHPHTLDLFICADSLRRGAGALVRTAELLVA